MNFTDDSTYIQSLIDKSEPFHKVVIPTINPRTGGRVYELTRAIELPSNTTVCIDNCVLRQADSSFDNIFRNANARTEAALSVEGTQENIHIYGIGDAVLDGGNPNGLTEYTWREMGRSIYGNCPIHLQNVRDFSVRNIKIQDHRYWGVTCHYCTDGVICDIRVHVNYNKLNQDGIDLRVGCKNIIIENIKGRTSDDLVALTNLNGTEAGLAVEGMEKVISNVIIRNVMGETTSGRGIVRLLNHCGNRIHDILIENVVDTSEKTWNSRCGAAVRIGENFYFGKGRPAQLGETSNITVRNVFTRGRVGVMASCTLSHALIDNIHMRDDGGTALLFQEGIYENVRVTNLNYAYDCVHHPADHNMLEGIWNRREEETTVPPEERKVCAVFFKGAHVNHLHIVGLTAGKSLTGVFGGYGSGEVAAECVISDGVPYGNPEGMVMEVETR